MVLVKDNCKHCNKRVYAHEKVSVQDFSFHVVCLVCNTCNLALTSVTCNLVEDRTYCTPHYRKECKRLGLAVTNDAQAAPSPKGSFVQQMIQHRDELDRNAGCDSCFACRGQLVGNRNLISVVKKTLFHKKCCVCVTCKMPVVDDNALIYGNQLYCEAHGNRARRTALKAERVQKKNSVSVESLEGSERKNSVISQKDLAAGSPTTTLRSTKSSNGNTGDNDPEIIDEEEEGGINSEHTTTTSTSTVNDGLDVNKESTNVNAGGRNGNDNNDNNDNNNDNDKNDNNDNNDDNDNDNISEHDNLTQESPDTQLPSSPQQLRTRTMTNEKNKKRNTVSYQSPNQTIGVGDNRKSRNSIKSEDNLSNVITNSTEDDLSNMKIDFSSLISDIDHMHGAVGTDEELLAGYENNTEDQDDVSYTDPDDAAAMKKARDHCDNVIKELLNTESLYVKDLTEVVKGYLEPIKQRTGMMTNESLPPNEKLPFSPDEVNKLFGNIELLNIFHGKLLTELMCLGKDLGSIGRLFIEKAEEMETLYSEYCNNSVHSERYLRNIMVLDLVKEKFLKFQSDVGHQLPLSCYLLKPIQRVLKYPLLFRELSKYSEWEDSDNEDCIRAHNMTQMLAAKVNNTKRQQERLEEYTKFKRQLVDIKSDGNLDYKADLANYGEFLLISRVSKLTRNFKNKEKRTLVLFAQKLIICLEKNEKYSIKETISIYEIDLREFEATGIEIHHSGKKSMILFSNPAERTEWYNMLFQYSSQLPENASDDGSMLADSPGSFSGGEISPASRRSPSSASALVGMDEGGSLNTSPVFHQRHSSFDGRKRGTATKLFLKSFSRVKKMGSGVDEKIIHTSTEQPSSTESLNSNKDSS